jgi:hypothetical protein
MGRVKGAAASLVSLPNPWEDPGVDPETHIRFVPTNDRLQPPDVATTKEVVPAETAVLSGEYRNYADPATGKVPTVAPIMRRELRRHRNDLLYGEISRVIRDYETFRTDEFHWRGSPPAAVAFHFGKNPRSLKYDGTHAIDHDRVGIEDQLRKEAWDNTAAYTHKIATEVCQQEFENMLCYSMDQIHDKRSTKYSQLRTKEEIAEAKKSMEQVKELRKAYRDKLHLDANEARKLVFCREPQIHKTYTGMGLTPVHTSTYHADGDNSQFN